MAAKLSPARGFASQQPSSPLVLAEGGTFHFDDRPNYALQLTKRPDGRTESHDRVGRFATERER
jgi:hypothetical protein